MVFFGRCLAAGAGRGSSSEGATGWATGGAGSSEGRGGGASRGAVGTTGSAGCVSAGGGADDWLPPGAEEEGSGGWSRRAGGPLGAFSSGRSGWLAAAAPSWEVDGLASPPSVEGVAVCASWPHNQKPRVRIRDVSSEARPRSNRGGTDVARFTRGCRLAVWARLSVPSFPRAGSYSEASGEESSSEAEDDFAFLAVGFLRVSVLAFASFPLVLSAGGTSST